MNRITAALGPIATGAPMAGSVATSTVLPIDTGRRTGSIDPSNPDATTNPAPPIETHTGSDETGTPGGRVSGPRGRTLPNGLTSEIAPENP